MSQMRLNQLTGRWVTIVAERAQRPTDFAPRSEFHPIDAQRTCPFCPGNEEATPPALETIDASGAWEIRVVPNLYPAFDGEGGFAVHHDGPVHVMAEGTGIHEVFVYTPEHERSLDQLDDDAAEPDAIPSADEEASAEAAATDDLTDAATADADDAAVARDAEVAGDATSADAAVAEDDDPDHEATTAPAIEESGPEAAGDDDEDRAAGDTDGEAEPTAEASAAPADEDGDVVVDLFARIRAGVTDDGGGAVPVADDADDHVTGPDDADDTGAPTGSSAPADDHVTGPADTEPLIVLGDEPLDVAGGSPDLGAEVEAGGGLDAVADGEVDDTSASPFARRDEDLTPLIVAAARKLKRVLADEQNEVLDALRRGEPVENLDILLPWASEHVARYTEAIADDLLAAARAGATSVAAGAAVKLRPKASKDAVARAGARLEEYVVAPLRERLDRAVADGAGDNGAITKKIRAVYREWKTQRIDEHLDDVVRVAHGRGLLGAIEPGTPVEWVTDPSVRPCADCDDNVLGGAVEAGAEFPTGHTFAPGHPGCRCLLQPAGR